MSLRRSVSLRQQFIKFPTGQQVSDTKNSFFRVAGFPNVLGCVDGTHIPIMRPKENEVDFVNRKSFHSLNCQMCCDSNFKITSCVATWPGSVHDSRIFRSSALCLQFENGDHDGFLLGDSGYCCRSFLLTPFLNAGSPAEQRYNDSLCRTRVIIEQTFGIFKKRRFQCLQKGLATDPKMASIYIVASVVLHNYGIERRDIIDIDRQQPAPQPSFQTPPNQQIANDGARMRKHIVDTFFSS
ncbi:hypothetical protein FSP39_014011 [Pinctada imbricata]|uniref:Putative nuclease HARBI1 n=1 Tax=Pinctada imbricata TaxID=66713 RepID=A0AA89BQW7_PINIB|nr:hypothetical protein FSP39_014011 [Pinctada imbricata]